MERFLCIAGMLQGQEFLRECSEQGVRPTVLTLDTQRDADWPLEAIEDLATMPAGLSRDQVLNTVCWMSRGRQFQRVIALDEADLEMAAAIREHLRIPGMGLTTAGYYRDRLAMRISARASGFSGPDFCRVLNYDELREFMAHTPPPWELKPRARMNGRDSFRIEDAEQLWRVLDQLGDLQSQYLLEQPLEGERFTVLSVVSERRVVFSLVLRQRVLAGGATLVETVDRGSSDWAELVALNDSLAPSLGLVRGIAQASFARSAEGSGYQLDEIVAGIASDRMALVTEAASGLNLWREWARMELAHLRSANYAPRACSDHYGVSLEYPAGFVAADTPELAAREIVSRTHANGREQVIFKFGRVERGATLVAGLAARIAETAASR